MLEEKNRSFGKKMIRNPVLFSNKNKSKNNFYTYIHMYITMYRRELHAQCIFLKRNFEPF